MDKTKDRFIFTMSIPLKAHEIAQQFCQKQPDARKAKQIYLNTLAVYSVNEYLGYLSIPTNLADSDSWNPSMQYLSDVADLAIPNYGRLECRPVLPDDQSCYVPPDVWGDRQGYVAIQFDSELKEASFLGFLPTVQSSVIALEEWEAFETLLEGVSEVANEVTHELISEEKTLLKEHTVHEEPPVLVTNAPAFSQTLPPDRKNDNLMSPFTCLSQWLEGAIEQGWQVIRHEFLSPELSPSFRSTPNPQIAASAQVVCSKQVNWASASDGVPLTLIIGLAPSDQSDEIDIWVKISTQEPDQPLPLDLELLIVDETEQPVIQTKSRGTEGIQLRFGGQPSEQFSVKVIQGSHEIVETFVV